MENAIDRIESNPHLIKNLGRIGLVVNQTSTSACYKSSVKIIDKAIQSTTGSTLSVIFGPQHGYAQTEQDNMIETPDSTFTLENGSTVPLFSLYSERRLPTAEQLKNVDTLVVDLQDIGCRVYTYMLTLAGCLRSAAQLGKKVVVLDRTNPLGLCYFDAIRQQWDRVEGNTLQKKWHSFVGWYEIPMRHGMSMGELGHYFIACDKLSVEYEVIPVDGLTRKDAQFETLKNGPWAMPSPNIPSWLSAVFFPAFVLLEGVNISEGRGTTLPFQLIGAPWLNAKLAIAFLHENENIYRVNPALSSGLIMREHHFRPTFNKHKGEICHGIQFHLEGLENVNLAHLGLCFLYFCAQFHAKDFQWSAPGYEYNFTDSPINLILGSDEVPQFLTALANEAKDAPMHGKKDDDLLRLKVKLAAFHELLKKQAQEAQGFAHNAAQFFIYK